jgi:uncharacterized protein YdeI (YjbR/CyaY-like superfamily)
MESGRRGIPAPALLQGRGMAGTTAPPDVAEALADDAPAALAFAGLAPSHKREYLSWIDEAKKPDTRRRRIAGMIGRLKGTQANGRDGQG